MQRDQGHLVVDPMNFGLDVQKLFYEPCGLKMTHSLARFRYFKIANYAAILKKHL
jgi:hypothetical protein